MDKIRLELIGITYNQIESGVYAVILQEMGGKRRIPIVIGYPEAQAIECKLQEVVTPRPLTHDLMVNSLSAFGISLDEVMIYRLPSGVFAAELKLSDADGDRTIDSRSSDAIALAIRVGAPIYTSAELLEEAGLDPDSEDNKSTERLRIAKKAKKNDQVVSLRADMSLKSIEELEKEMEQASEAEDYEKAARLKAEIERRREKDKPNSAE